MRIKYEMLVNGRQHKEISACVIVVCVHLESDIPNYMKPHSKLVHISCVLRT